MKSDITVLYVLEKSGKIALVDLAAVFLELCNNDEYQIEVVAR